MGLAVLLYLTAALGGCDSAPVESEIIEVKPTPTSNLPKLGLMTSLPLYWPLGADFAAIAGGEAKIPWQRALFERDHKLVLLDTLSPIPGLSEDVRETDPLSGLNRIAVIQPRGLSPADNVALDDWVQRGGHLLIALDPLLTGEYDMALGDPRRPTDTALIPPVIERWGMKITVDEGAFDSPQTVQLPHGEITTFLGGNIQLLDEGAGECELSQGRELARCQVGQGQVTLLADAAMFEDVQFAGTDGEDVIAFLRSAFP